MIDSHIIFYISFYYLKSKKTSFTFSKDYNIKFNILFLLF